MAKVQDVAAYILTKLGKITAMKLQKLVYYCQAWSLVWDEKPLFTDKIEAWANGPVIPALYEMHKGEFELAEFPIGNPQQLTTTEKETIDAVLEFYGDKSSQWLSDLTHQENPWLNARKGLVPGERGNQEITLAAMAEYNESL
jgi:uncharacterized phage-associated protein